MRNVKLLWGIIVVLSAAVLVLARLIMFHTETSPAPSGEQEKAVIAKIGSKEIKQEELKEDLYQKHGPERINQILDREAIRLEAEQSGVKVTDEEVKQELQKMEQGYASEEDFYRSMKEQLGLTKEELRQDAYYKLMVEAIATHNILITDKEVDSYIASHGEEFKDTIQLRIRQITNENLDQAQKTYDLAKSGTDFSLLAQQRSLDINTANEGGDLGWVEADDPFVPKAILKAANELQVGQVSKPIKLDSGYAVIKLQDRKEQSRGSVGDIRETVRKELALQKAPAIKEVIRLLREKNHAQILDPRLKPST